MPLYISNNNYSNSLPISPISPIPENVSNINGPLLVSTVLNGETFVNYEYQELQTSPINNSYNISSLEEGMISNYYYRSLKSKKKNFFYIDFNDKGKKVKKITI